MDTTKQTLNLFFTVIILKRMEATLKTVKPYLSAVDWEDYTENVWPEKREFLLKAVESGDYSNLYSLRGERTVTLPYAVRDEKAEEEFKKTFINDIDTIKSKLQLRTDSKDMRSKSSNNLRKFYYPWSAMAGIGVGISVNNILAGIGAFASAALVSELLISRNQRNTRKYLLNDIEEAKNNITVTYVQDSFKRRL
jgi:hypothetical protein